MTPSPKPSRHRANTNISARYIRAWLERSSSNPPGNHRDRRPDPARHAIEDPTAIQPHLGRGASSRRERLGVDRQTSRDPDRLEPRSASRLHLEVAEETCGVTDKAGPSRRSTKLYTNRHREQ